MKTCTICGIEKDESEFPKDKRLIGGYRRQCKMCRNIISNESRKKKPEKYKEQLKKYREEHPFNYFYHKNKNPERLKKRVHGYYLKNKEKNNFISKKWVIENPEKRKEIANRYSTKKSLKKQIGETPPPELVEVKLIINKTKRLCKTLKN